MFYEVDMDCQINGDTNWDIGKVLGNKDRRT